MADLTTMTDDEIDRLVEQSTEQLRAQLETITKENSALRERAERAEALNASLMDEINEAAITLSDERPRGTYRMTRQISKLLGERDGYKGRAATLAEQLAASESARQQAQDGLAAEEETNERLRAESKSLEFQLNTAIADRKQAEAERDEAQADAAAIRVTLGHARSEITRLATDGGGFSCRVIDDIEAALATNAGSTLLAELTRLREALMATRRRDEHVASCPLLDCRECADLRDRVAQLRIAALGDSSARSQSAKVEARHLAPGEEGALTAPTELQSEAEKSHEIARETRRLAVLFHMNPNEDNLARLRYQLDRTVGLAERAEAERGNG